MLSPEAELVALLTELSDEYVLALTLYGEGRKPPHQRTLHAMSPTGLRALGWMFWHRVHDSHARWSRSYKVACLQRGPSEVWTWNTNDGLLSGVVGLAKFTAGGPPPTEKDRKERSYRMLAQYELCRRIAHETINARDARDDLVRGANTYHRHGSVPGFLLARSPVASVDGRFFYRL